MCEKLFNSLFPLSLTITVSFFVLLWQYTFPDNCHVFIITLSAKNTKQKNQTPNTLWSSSTSLSALQIEYLAYFCGIFRSTLLIVIVSCIFISIFQTLRRQSLYWCFLKMHFFYHCSHSEKFCIQLHFTIFCSLLAVWCLKYISDEVILFTWDNTAIFSRLIRLLHCTRGTLSFKW